MCKKFLLLFAIAAISICPAMALKYSEAVNSSKPMALLVYANWADGLQGVAQTFGIMEQQYNSSYNFVRMNIADADTKAFNQKYHIYPNLPYVLLFKEGGKISRYLPKDCASDTGCFANKLNLFKD